MLEGLSQETVITDCIEQLPWIEALSQKDSNASKLVKKTAECFNRFQVTLLHILSKLEGRTKPYQNLLELFYDNEEIALAILIQNCLHPKNDQRVYAIKTGSYVEIDSLDSARYFLKEQLRKNLETELMAAKSSLLDQFIELNQVNYVKALLEAPDVYIAAAALTSQNFSIGKGDRTVFLDSILSMDPTTIPDLGRKLNLITSDEFMGLPLYNDKICSPCRVNR